MSTGNKNLSIGVVGNGFVGDAVNNGFLHQNIPCKVYDKNPIKTLNTIEEVLDCEFVFEGLLCWFVTTFILDMQE